MSQVTQRGAVAPEMNVTPLIDVTFLLIIFFMLVSNIISEENVPMVVPDLDDPKTQELGEVVKVVVNIVPAPSNVSQRKSGNPLDVAGNAQGIKVGVMDQMPFDAEGMARLTEILKERIETGPKKDDGSTALEVVLRADAGTFYEDVQPVLKAITDGGIAKVNMAAFVEEQQ